MRAFEVQERAAADVDALGDAHAIAYGALRYIADSAGYFERCREVASKAIDDIQRVFDER